MFVSVENVSSFDQPAESFAAVYHGAGGAGSSICTPVLLLCLERGDALGIDPTLLSVVDGLVQKKSSSVLVGGVNVLIGRWAFSSVIVIPSWPRRWNCRVPAH
jgi:hypothetical protein